MKQCVIDCSRIANPEDFHDALVEALVLPQWYGSNLDALYDCLTAITQETEIVLLHFKDLNDMFSGFQTVFQEASEENPRIRIVVL